jgi:hypothetical protein
MFEVPKEGLMSMTKRAFILAIIIAVAAIAGWITANNPIALTSVHANQGRSAERQRWEYCAIMENNYFEDNFGPHATATIRYFQISGFRDETVEFNPELGKRYVDKRLAFAKAVAKLGDAGWEMVSTESHNEGFSPIYFKRPKQ